LGALSKKDRVKLFSKDDPDTYLWGMIIMKMKKTLFGSTPFKKKSKKG